MNEIAITIVLRQRYVRVKVGCMVKFDKTKKGDRELFYRLREKSFVEKSDRDYSRGRANKV